MTCPRCHCAECRRAIIRDRLSTFLISRETDSYGIGPAITHDLPLVEAENERMKKLNAERDAWADTLAGDVVGELRESA